MRRVLLSLSALLFMNGICFAQGSGSDDGVGMIKACPKSPNCISSLDEDPDHAITPLTYTGSRAEAMACLKRVLASLKRTAIVSETENYLHAEATSLIFRFVDDVDFYFPPDEKTIHMRSASRVGYSDLGVNRRRLEEIRRRMDEMK